jgi:hypothetical protein
MVSRGGVPPRNLGVGAEIFIRQSLKGSAGVSGRQILEFRPLTGGLRRSLCAPFCGRWPLRPKHARAATTFLVERVRKEPIDRPAIIKWG